MKRTVDKEQYFTQPALAARCVDHADDLLDLRTFDHVVDPGAGAGAFFDRLPVERRIGVDLEPLRPSIERADFLSWEPPAEGRILTIGNPPFGQRGSLAVAFLERACRFSDAVAFILPRSFNKYTFQNRVHPNFHLVGGFPCEDFHLVGGRPRTVRTVFQVWQRRDVERARIVLPDSHPDFAMRHAHLSRTSAADRRLLCEAYEFAIPQVGSRFRPRDPQELTRGSHWFIAPNVAHVRARFERLDLGFLDDMNTAHKSLSKRDIVLAYERVAATD